MAGCVYYHDGGDDGGGAMDNRMVEEDMIVFDMNSGSGDRRPQWRDTLVMGLKSHQSL